MSLPNRTAMLLCALSLAGVGVQATERVQCPATADNWVETPPWEPHARESRNYGLDRHLIVNSRNSFALLAFDMAPARGLRIEKALLRVHREPDPIPLTMAGISTISGSGPWSEGEMNYFFARKGQPWSYPGSDLADVVFGLGGSLYAYVKAHDAGGGWYEIDIPPQIAASLATGDQFGIMLTDEKGQTRTRHIIGSRESADPPVLILEGTRANSTPGRMPSAVPSAAPGAVPGPVKPLTPRSADALGRTSLRPGSAILHFSGSGAVHYDLRFSEALITAKNFDTAAPVPRWMLDPLASHPNPLVTSNSLQDQVNAIVEQLQPGKLY
ncbi:MAG TPA: hypothetical protein VNY05_35015, partial [Candidatus Acidoferrales bacterium]|nr:hypothetical protein [Candidatus Acidoferrales bacterium]